MKLFVNITLLIPFESHGNYAYEVAGTNTVNKRGVRQTSGKIDYAPDYPKIWTETSP